MIFASIMRGAVRDGYIRKSPCVDIRLPEIAKTLVRLLTPEQVIALASAMPARYRVLVLLGAGTGLRQGEAFGLAADRRQDDHRRSAGRSHRQAAGHRSITTTVDLYGHLVPEASGRARDALDKAFGQTTMCPQSAPTPSQ